MQIRNKAPQQNFQLYEQVNKILQKTFNKSILLCIVFFILSAYVNNYLIVKISLNISAVSTIIVAFLPLFFFSSFLRTSLKKSNGWMLLSVSSIVIMLFFVEYYFYASMSNQLNRMNKFYRVAPFLLSIPASYIIVKINNINFFIKCILFLSVISVGMIFLDYKFILAAFLSGSRGHLLVSPLNISSLNYIAALIAFYLYKNEKKKLYLPIFFVCIVMSLVGMSRGPMISFTVAFIYLYFQMTKNKKVVIIYILIVFLVFVPIIIFLGAAFDIPAFNQLFFSFQSDSSIDYRLSYYSFVIDKIFTDNIIFGNGVDSFNSLYGGEAKYPHNILLEMAFEIGLLPTLLFFIVMCYTFIKVRTENIILATLFIYFFVTAMFSSDLRVLSNILIMEFSLVWIYLFRKHANFLVFKNEHTF